ncbi:MAG: N-acetyltransferase [Pseudomonadota bacterium]
MNKDSFRIRDCLRSDLENVCQIEKVVFGTIEAIPRIAFTQYFDLFAPTFVVAESLHHVFGFSVGGIAIDNQVRLGWLLDIAILPGYQGSGIGRAMSQCIVDRLIQNGVTRVLATVAPENERSLKMLKKIRFQVIDDIPDYFGAGQSRLLMELKCEI